MLKSEIYLEEKTLFAQLFADPAGIPAHRTAISPPSAGRNVNWEMMKKH